jgi:DNA-binding transcriptional LysR family regulator
MDLRRLAHFLAVAGEGSINAAAARCHITQAGLTKSIRGLEAEVGAQLFERSPRGVRLTRQGQEFLRHARLLQNQGEAALASISAIGAGREVELRVGVSMRWALKLIMPRLFARLARDPARPRMTVVSGQKSWKMIEDLRDGALDLLLATPTERDDLTGLEARFFRRDPQGIVVRRGHPLDGAGRLELADLAGWDWISGTPETYFRNHLEGLFRARNLIPPVPRMTSDSSTLILDTVARTDLIGMATERLISVEHAGRVVILDTPARLERTTAVLTRAGDVLPETAERLITAIGEELEATLGEPS